VALALLPVAHILVIVCIFGLACKAAVKRQACSAAFVLLPRAAHRANAMLLDNNPINSTTVAVIVDQAFSTHIV
jgi:hypothetical protein